MNKPIFTMVLSEEDGRVDASVDFHGHVDGPTQIHRLKTAIGASIASAAELGQRVGISRQEMIEFVVSDAIKAIVESIETE